MLKLQDNPPVTPVAAEGRSVFDLNERKSAGWVALYTKPRQEKALAADFLQLGIDYFLPLVRKVTISGGRRRTALHPLFPSYLFADLGDEQRRLSALRTDRIVQVVTPEPSQLEGFVRELSAIEAAVLHCPEQIELQPRVVDGARVRITGGAMKGIEGIVVKSSNRTRICLRVSTLCAGVLVEIEGDLLEPQS